MLLRSHIDDSGSPAREWAQAFGISEPHLSRILSGQKLPSLRLAVAIERKTSGAVPASSWVPEPENQPEKGAA